MKRGPLSLRAQLVTFGLAATVLPVIVLFVVVLATVRNEEVLGDAGGVAISESTSSGVPAAVAWATLALAGVAAAAVWIWSARAVRPMRDITALADDIQAGSLDRRLGAAGHTREAQELSDSFDRMLDRLESASTAQHRLIEDVGHELRTPLAALAGNLEVIRNHPAPTGDDYRQSLDRSEALVDRLQATVDDLLHGARARAHRDGQVDNDLMAIVERVAGAHRSAHPTVPIDVHGPDRLLAPVDGPSMERALTNLVANAARFSPAGAPVQIVVSDRDPVTVTVTDQGPGIDADHLPRVFDRYWRADPRAEATGDTGTSGDGHGIGLALAKQVADAHGSIRVESPINGATGTRFVMEIRR